MCCKVLHARFLKKKKNGVLYINSPILKHVFSAVSPIDFDGAKSSLHYPVLSLQTDVSPEGTTLHI